MQESNSLNVIYLDIVKNGQIFNTALNKSAALVCSEVAHALKAERCGVWLLDQEGSQLNCLSRYTTANSEYEDNLIALEKDCPEFFATLDTMRVTQKDSSSCNKAIVEFSKSQNEPIDHASLLAVSLRCQGKAQGVIYVEKTCEQHNWTHYDIALLTNLGDLFSQRLMHEQMIRSNAQHLALFEATNEGIIVFSNGLFSDVNPALCNIFGAPKHQLIGKNPVIFSPEHQPNGDLSAEKAMSYIQACMQGTPQNFEWVHQRTDGTLFDADITLNAVRLHGEDTLFGIVRDISDRKNAERKEEAIKEEIRYRASHDSLTGLMNREMVHKEIETMIEQAEHQSVPCQIALLLFDLNRFKEVNDTLGHATGDKVLQQVAIETQKKVVDAGGQLFRLGGDEFVAIFNSASSTLPHSKLEGFVVQCLQTPIVVDDISIEMQASIGIATYPKDGVDSNELLRCADVAMYHSKENETASSWYSPENDVNTKRRLAMMVELGIAIRENQLMLHYQPRIQIDTGNVTGCEALLRWNHPTLGMVPPNEFIPLAEMSDLIHPLTAWVLQSAFQQMSLLKAKGHPIPIAINISARNLIDSKLIETIESLVKQDEDAIELLEFEITESALIDHPQVALNNLNKLEKLGLSIAIDDYGTGYSSLSYLKKLPVNTLKIDQSFVKDMLSDISDSFIVDSTIHLAHNFSMAVVAEGVEDQETLDALKANNCDQAQGYHIARPMPGEDLYRWLESHPKIDTVVNRAA